MSTPFETPDGTRVEEARMLDVDENVPASFARQLSHVLNGCNLPALTSYLVLLGGDGLAKDGPQNIAMIGGGLAEDVHALWSSALKYIEGMGAMQDAAAEADHLAAVAADGAAQFDDVPTQVLEAALKRRREEDESFSLEALASRMGFRFVPFVADEGA